MHILKSSPWGLRFQQEFGGHIHSTASVLVTEDPLPPSSFFGCAASPRYTRALSSCAEQRLPSRGRRRAARCGGASVRSTALGARAAVTAARRLRSSQQRSHLTTTWSLYFHNNTSSVIAYLEPLPQSTTMIYYYL